MCSIIYDLYKLNWSAVSSSGLIEVDKLSTPISAVILLQEAGSGPPWPTRLQNCSSLKIKNLNLAPSLRQNKTSFFLFFFMNLEIQFQLLWIFWSYIQRKEKKSARRLQTLQRLTTSPTARCVYFAHKLCFCSLQKTKYCFEYLRQLEVAKISMDPI